MDPQLIAAAMDQARQQIDDAPRILQDRSSFVASPRPAVQAIGYAQPTDPDAYGFVAIGELHDPARTRTGMVLRYQASGSVRLTWTTEVARSSDAAPRGGTNG